MADFKVHILGCGSAAPNRMGQHGSSQCVEYKGHYYLLDCGENTQYSMFKQRIPFNKIDAIFISHLHGDHFLGFIGLMSTIVLTSKRSKPIHIYAPEGFEDMISTLMESIIHYFSFPLVFHVIDKAGEIIFQDVNLSVTTLSANHSKEQTYGFLIKENEKKRNIIPEKIVEYNIPYHLIKFIKDGSDFTTENGDVIPNEELTTDPKERLSYAYCSDTYECPELNEALNGTTVVYHETSFLEREIENAIRYKHSTPKIAAQVAKDAGAKKLIMGHLSARYGYEDLPIFIEEARQIFNNCEIAEENKTIEII